MKILRHLFYDSKKILKTVVFAEAFMSASITLSILAPTFGIHVMKQLKLVPRRVKSELIEKDGRILSLQTRNMWRTLKIQATLKMRATSKNGHVIRATGTTEEAWNIEITLNRQVTQTHVSNATSQRLVACNILLRYRFTTMSWRQNNSFWRNYCCCLFCVHAVSL